MKSITVLLLLSVAALAGFAQMPLQAGTDTGVHYIYDVGAIKPTDTVPTVNLPEVNVVYFKTADEWLQYYQYKSRIEKVMPYVKIAKQLYVELMAEKENEKKRAYHHDRKDLEKEMRGRFEKELKDLTTTQGEMLFKLVNRETGNNAYNIIKELKNPFTAWMYQMIGKRYGYNLKETYNPQKEKLIELIIKQMGPAYNVNS